MWKPAKSLNWQLEAKCAQPENKESMGWFFSKEPKEKYAAKNLVSVALSVKSAFSGPSSTDRSGASGAAKTK